MNLAELFLATTPIVGAGFFSAIWQGIKTGFIYALEWIFDLTAAIGMPSYVLALFFFTLILKLLLQPMMNKQLRSTRLMQRLTPEVNEIKRRYASDQVKQNQKVMELYKENNASPTAGCLPLLLQMPILIALFEALRNFVPAHPEYYNFYWITNLSMPDSTIILPLIAGLATFLQQKLSTVNSADRTQKMMLYIFPVMFFFMVRSFPAGLSFYWIFYSLIGAAIMYPLKRKWAAEDKKYEEEQAAKREVELAEKRAKKMAAAVAKKKKGGPKQSRPVYKTEDGDELADPVDEFDEDELDFEAEPEEGEDLYHWIARRGIRIKRKKVKEHPYSSEETLLETCVLPDGKQVDISVLQKEYAAFTTPPPPPPDFKALLGLSKKKKEQPEAASAASPQQNDAASDFAEGSDFADGADFADAEDAGLSDQEEEAPSEDASLPAEEEQKQ